MTLNILQPFKITGELIFLFFYGIYSYIYLLYRAVHPPSLKSLDGEIALITGSASGIGRELTLHLAKHHPRVKLVLWDSNESLNRETAQDARLIGSTVSVYKVDVTNRNQVEETAAKVEREVGDVTILFNNAGIAGSAEFLTMSADLLEKIIQVNLISHFWTLRAFLPKMIERNHGHIVTISSGASFRALRYGSGYSAAKHGIRGYLESVRSELRYHPLKPTNIQFTTVFPFFVHTPMTSHLTLTTKFGMKFLEAKQVADAIIRGLRQNQENIFLPGRLELSVRLMGLMPRCLLTKIEDFIVENVDIGQGNASHVENIKND